MIAALTTLPVLGVPVESAALSGIDSLYSIVQMPGGVPVGTLAIGRPGAINAALLAAAILAPGRSGAGRRASRRGGRGRPTPWPRRPTTARRRDRHRARRPRSASSAAASSAAWRRWRRPGWAIAATSSHPSPTAPPPTWRPHSPARTTGRGGADCIRGRRRRGDARVRERAGGNARVSWPRTRPDAPERCRAAGDAGPAGREGISWPGWACPVTAYARIENRCGP